MTDLPAQADVVSQMGKIMRGSTEKKKTRQDIQENGEFTKLNGSGYNRLLISFAIFVR